MRSHRCRVIPDLTAERQSLLAAFRRRECAPSGKDFQDDLSGKKGKCLAAWNRPRPRIHVRSFREIRTIRQRLKQPSLAIRR